jgi:hypothetical protein
MTRACCTSCRLRFSGSAGHLVTCPFCAQPLVRLSADAALGLKRFGSEDPVAEHGLDALAAAVAVPPPRPQPFA